jgi:hypothetical protein
MATGMIALIAHETSAAVLDESHCRPKCILCYLGVHVTAEDLPKARVVSSPRGLPALLWVAKAPEVDIVDTFSAECRRKRRLGKAPTP